MTDVDLDQELEDIKAIDGLETVTNDSREDEEENEVSKCGLFISQISHLVYGAQYLLPLHKHRRTQHPKDYLVIPFISAPWP